MAREGPFRRAGDCVRRTWAEVGLVLLQAIEQVGELAREQSAGVDVSCPESASSAAETALRDRPSLYHDLHRDLGPLGPLLPQDGQW
ncbi:hypothetical protein [Saccharopolyspora phatthalungensis]|uniref:Uncharacterized protein n=1 Tax=Saccharopolyspora phatthalungensis TaxID=664693 RepID=A0A840QAT7_9PSEU|nr:hypothetical protein [Saccharopolyspora phatthalungensis]MBB5156930.1 hypothetical protein [Saccharopolyspora phatthalungensis]